MIIDNFVKKGDVLKQDFDEWVGFDRHIAGGRDTKGKENSMSMGLELTRSLAFLGSEILHLFWKQEVSNIVLHSFLLQGFYIGYFLCQESSLPLT